MDFTGTIAALTARCDFQDQRITALETTLVDTVATLSVTAKQVNQLVDLVKTMAELFDRAFPNGDLNGTTTHGDAR